MVPFFIYKDKYWESNGKFRRPNREEKQTGCLRQKFGWAFNEFLGQKFIKSDSPHYISYSFFINKLSDYFFAFHKNFIKRIKYH